MDILAFYVFMFVLMFAIIYIIQYVMIFKENAKHYTDHSVSDLNIMTINDIEIKFKDDDTVAQIIFLCTFWFAVIPIYLIYLLCMIAKYLINKVFDKFSVVLMKKEKDDNL